MRDDSARWRAPGSLTHESGELQVRPAPLPAQAYVSGRDVLQHLAHAALAWPDPAPQTGYALVLRRDRVLFVGDPGFAPGYHADAGVAVSDVTQKYTVLSLCGPRAMDHLKRGAELRLDHPSRSVARQIFGIDVLLYKDSATDGFRVHVPAALAQAFFERLVTPI